MLRRLCFFAYGIAAYGLSCIAILYLIGFVGNWYVPKTIDQGLPATSAQSVALAIVMNLGCIAVFGLQHSIMARPWFKKRWQQIVPEPIERSSFLLATVLVLLILFWQWRPLEGHVWHVPWPAGRWAIGMVSLSGWGLMLYSSFVIDHFELFGLRQVTRYLLGKSDSRRDFVERSLYKQIRHPLMTGVMIAIWAAPTMTWGHLLFSLGFTSYIFIGVWWEERDLLETLGPIYADYRTRTRKFIPLPVPRSAGGWWRRRQQ